MNTQSWEDQEANHTRLTFRCLDLGIKDCRWQISGDNENEILPNVATHFRESHDLGFDDATRVMVRRAIRR